MSDDKKPDATGADDKKPAEGEGPKYITREDLDKTVNKILSASESRTLASVEKLLTEKLAALAPKKDSADEDDDAEPTAPSASPPAAQSAATPDVDKRIKSLQRRLDSAEKARAEAEAAAKERDA